MRENGHPDARLTPSGADGGVDIDSLHAIGQVKRHTKPVGLAAMQRMDSIALHQRKKALFFSTGGFTPKAREWARDHQIEMYEMPAVLRVRRLAAVLTNFPMPPSCPIQTPRLAPPESLPDGRRSGRNATDPLGAGVASVTAGGAAAEPSGSLRRSG